MAGHEGPRRDTRGIVDAPELFAHVQFRRREPAPELRAYLEHYWLIDWDLSQPYASHLVPHPSVNLVFERYAGCGDEEAGYAEVSGIGLELFTQKLEGRGRVCGVQFRPGGFRPFAPGAPVSRWTGRRLPAADVFAPPAPPAAVLDPEAEDDRVAALDAYLLALGPEPDPRADLAMALVDLVRTDRSVLRVDGLARAEGVSARSLQRLFAAYVGVGPKWVILRYRIHEALERAAAGPDVDWAALAADLGYSDQAHLIRDFTATLGVPPTALGARRGPGVSAASYSAVMADVKRTTASSVRIEPWSDDDLELLRSANAPELMAHLGGPETEEQLMGRHARYVALSADRTGRGRMFRVALAGEAEAVGTIGFWERPWRDQEVYETGWTVLPEFQGRGIASAATRAVAEAARAERKHRYLHAYPSVENGPSNGVCRKAGFTLLGECEIEYPPGHPLLTNDWRLDLRADG